MPPLSSEGIDVRRSARQSCPTTGGENYRNSIKAATTTQFPSTGDKIKVKWIIGSRSVWWPATVTHVQPHSSRERSCAGTILYHELEQYDEVRTSVVFSTSSQSKRFVSSIDGNQSTSDSSSWIYHDESISSEDEEENDKTDSSEDAEEQSDSDAEMIDNHRVNEEDGKNSRYRSSKRDNMNKSRGSSSGKISDRRKLIERRKSRSAISKPVVRKSTSNRGNRTSKSKSVPENDESLDDESSFDSSVVVNARKREVIVMRAEDEISGDERIVAVNVRKQRTVSRGGNTQLTRRNAESDSQVGQKNETKDQTDLNIRLLLLERRLADANLVTSTALSSSANSVLVSLKWAFLKALEKPLKPLHLPGLVQKGIAYQELSVNSQCDYYTFKEIAASLAKEYHCSSENSRLLRVAFSPSFATTQSGSSASDDMNILFSSLSDLTTFLRIRDDNDFEKVLSKELLSETSSIMRILGTFTVDNTGDIQQSEFQARDPSNTTTTNSVSASSESCDAIRIFVGTSPVNYVTTASLDDNNVGTSDDHSVFHSTIFQQECRDFCSLQKCYRMPWTFKHMKSTLSVSCSFNLDGTVTKGELKNYFFLNWKRQAAPSSMKWTRDVHDIGNNSPGALRLSVPVMYFVSSRNVRSLVALFDKHIETFMRLRAKIHSSSSFK